MTDIFTPAKNKTVKIVRDLDAIVADPVGVYLHGRVRMLKPIDTHEFLSFMEEWNSFNIWKQTAKPTPDEVVDRLYKLFKTVTNEINRSDVSKMKVPQVAAFISVIFDTVSGKIFQPEMDDDIKKKMRKRLSDFPQAN